MNFLASWRRPGWSAVLRSPGFPKATPEGGYPVSAGGRDPDEGPERLGQLGPHVVFVNHDLLEERLVEQAALVLRWNQVGAMTVTSEVERGPQVALHDT
jgi:hypothetical protein